MATRLHFLFLAALLFYSAAFAESALSAPKLVDVGRLQGGELGSFAFTVRNASRGEINITQIKPSCVCTNVKLDGSEKLAPGEERKITGSVSFNGTLGDYETKIAIAYRSAEEQYDTTVAVRGKLIGALALEKTLIDFGEIDVKSGIQTVAFEAKRGNSGEEWDLIQPVVDDEHLNVAVEKDSDALFRLVVRFSPSGLPISVFRDIVKLRLVNRSGQALPNEIEFPVTARIRGPMRATPPSIFLGVITPDQTLERSVVVSSSDLDLQEVTMEKQPENGTADLQYMEKGKVKLTVRLTLPGSAKAPGEKLTLLHKSSGTRLSIPILGAMKGVDLEKR